MKPNSRNPKRKRLIWIIVVLFISILSAFGLYLYNNFNQLLSEALLKNFNSNIISDVYELKFEKLRVNLAERSIRVYGVSVEPREKPLRVYPYINSSFRLTTEKLTLMNVEIFTLLNRNQLVLERISITKPDIQLLLSGEKHLLIPFKDSTAVANEPVATNKKSIDAYFLGEFQLIDASFHVINSKKQREFGIENFNISLHELEIHQQYGRNLVNFKKVELSVGKFNGDLKEGAIKHIALNDFKIGIDSLDLQSTPDTLIFHFKDFNAGLKALDIQTADSLFHLSLQAFDLSYRERSMQLTDVLFKPNISDAALQNRFHYQHTNMSGLAGSINLVNVNFDSLIYQRGLYIDEIIVDKPALAIFKDNTKPVDENHLPIYFGQQLKSIRFPLLIRKVNVTNIQLENTERKRDSTYAKVVLKRGTAAITNITNLSTKEPLTLNANAYLDNKVHFTASLGFSYAQPQFSLNAKLEKFNLPDLNPILEAYTPAKITAGTADEITFSGTVFRTYSEGTMSFLYHDLEVDLAIQNKAKWKSAVIAFAANTYVNSSNPLSGLPPRVVKYRIDRDMHKGFINIVLKSALMGLKETMIMNKENRKAYKAAKKKSRSEDK